MYIRRELQSHLIEHFRSERPQGLIVAGIVGAGKTTLVERVLRELRDTYEIFRFTGDDTVFRAEVGQNSQSIYVQVTSATNKRALVFVDEVQKSEAVFEALKLAFDRGRISFIVSGSNPAFLDTVAKKRLQRRAEYVMLLPFSLPEILLAEHLIEEDLLGLADALLNDPKHVAAHPPQLSLTPAIAAAVRRFFTWGGLPLAYLTRGDRQRLLEIRKVVERGFEPISVDAEHHGDVIRVELAHLHSREFAYLGIFQKTGIRRREKINATIDDLVNHGYLVAKRPYILEQDRRSYLVSYSYIDPGIVSFLTSTPDPHATLGQRIEGYVHARLSAFVKQSPLKSRLWYYKPYAIFDGKLKFLPGEIDFVVEGGSKLLPIEVKAAQTRAAIQTPHLERLISAQKLPCGLVFYGGVPHWDKTRRILYWPYWLV